VSAIAYVAFDGFYVAGLSRKDPALAKAPLAVLRSRRVLDSSQSARKIGIVPGMSASEAKYAGHGKRVRFIEYEPQDYTDAASKWLDVCCEYCSVVEPIEPHCAFLDLSALAGAREIALPLAADIYNAVRICPRIGIASSKLVARAAMEVVPEGEDAMTLAPMPIESLWTAKPEYIRRLRFLGYRTIGEVAQLPAEVLHGQFGQDGLQLTLFARGKDRSPVKPIYPPERLMAKFNFPQPARLDQEVEAGLKSLAYHLGNILRARDCQTKIIELEVVFDSRAIKRAVREFVNPMQSPGALLTGIRLTLRRIALDRDITSIRTRLINVAPAERGQLDLVEQTNQTDTPPAIERLKSALGKDIIKRASEVEPPRRRRVLRAYGGKPKWIS
jgi:nucleotidyltransferase/DNA polymerase involved in DNA repair